MTPCKRALTVRSFHLKVEAQDRLHRGVEGQGTEWNISQNGHICIGLEMEEEFGRCRNLRLLEQADPPNQRLLLRGRPSSRSESGFYIAI